jgi:magnesium chelatase subunit I
MSELIPPKEAGYTRTVRSLRELVDIVTGREFESSLPHEDSGLAEVLPYPFLGLVGQFEMKLALLLSIINPMVNGVILVGPRGTGKTTAARSLIDLLPDIQRSLCFYGCLPEDIETSGMDAVCPDCAKKWAEGQPLTRPDRAHLIELPLNARLDDVVGGLDEHAQAHARMRIRRGILAHADLNVLYADEVNLLEDDIVNALLDASSAGTYTLRRGQASANYRSRFTLIGSMNPEEGNLRPQIMDRFGLRIIVRGLEDNGERLEAYRRAKAYRINPRATVAQFNEETAIAREEIQVARRMLPKVEIPANIAKMGIQVIQELKVDSLRAEITLFEAARAYAAAAARTEVEPADLEIVAPMALRLRKTPFMVEYFEKQSHEDAEIQKILEKVIPPQ